MESQINVVDSATYILVCNALTDGRDCLIGEMLRQSSGRFSQESVEAKDGRVRVLAIENAAPTDY